MARTTEPPSSKAVGIWIRVSTEDQARGESPEHHEKRARLYAEAKEWKVHDIYHLEAVSGKAVMAHPEAQRMLKDIRAGRITGLIFSKLARLARNTRELLDFADIFRDHGADLISLQEAIDTTSPAGRLFYTMIAAMAQWEREEIASRVAASIPIRAKLGKSLGGAAPFGYQWKNQRLIPDPTEAPVRKLLHELFVEHRRKKTVARFLNEKGYRTRNGSRFTDTTVDRLLRDPTAKGVRRANYTNTDDRTKSWKLKPETEWVLSSVPAVVSEALWEECNRILNAQQAGRKPARKTVQLFAGIVMCGCGQKMYVPSNTPKYVCYRCRNKIPIVDLEGIFHDHLKSFVFSPEAVRDYLGQADEVIKGKEHLFAALKAEEGKLRRDMDRIYDLYMAEKLTKDGFGERYQPLADQLKQVEDGQPRLQAEIDVLKIQYLSSDQILSDARDFYTRWPSLGFEEKRRVVEAITEKIVVGKGEVEIQITGIGTPASPLPPLDPPVNDGLMATLQQGFIAATSWTRAG